MYLICVIIKSNCALLRNFSLICSIFVRKLTVLSDPGGRVLNKPSKLREVKTEIVFFGLVWAASSSNEAYWKIISFSNKNKKSDVRVMSILLIE